MVELFFVLLISGLILIGIEVFVPGAVLGTLGGMALLGSVIVGFSAFGPETGTLIGLATLILVGVVLALWIRFFPGSRIGRKMTVSQDFAATTVATTGIGQLLNEEGEALGLAAGRLRHDRTPTGRRCHAGRDDPQGRYRSGHASGG